MQNLKCYHCGKGIDVNGGYRMVAIEVPYCNLFFHVGCYLSVLSEHNNDISVYINSDVDKFLKNLSGKNR